MWRSRAGGRKKQEGREVEEKNKHGLATIEKKAKKEESEKLKHNFSIRFDKIPTYSTVLLYAYKYTIVLIPYDTRILPCFCSIL